MLCNWARLSCHALTLLSSRRCIKAKWVLVRLNTRVGRGRRKERSSVQPLLVSHPPTVAAQFTGGKNNTKAPLSTMITGHLIGVTVNKGFDCTQKSCSGVCLVKKSMVEDCLVHLEEGGGMEGGEGAVECIRNK